MRIVCPAYAKVKEDKKRKIWYFDTIGEAHNHKLQPSARMVRYMHAHKQREAAMDDLVAIMSRSGVPNQAVMNVMSELYGGRQNWPFTEKDIQTCKSYVRWQSNTWLFFGTWHIIARLSSVWLQKQHDRLWLQKLFFVCDCKNCWLFLWLQKEKKNWTSVWLHYFACVLASRSHVWLQNLTVSEWLKSYLFIWYMITSLGSVWLQNSRVISDCKTIFCVWLQKLLVYFCNWKEKKELNQCVIATIWRVWLQPGVICGCKTWLCLCGCNLLGYLVYDCKPG
jgi:hypothetical protein